MNKFNIAVLHDKPKKIDGILAYKGQITIGKFQEAFSMPLDSWSKEDYVQQWRDGLERIKMHNLSCLVTSIENLASGYPTVELWTLHKQGDSLFFHNQLLFDETVSCCSEQLSKFSSENCYEFINPRVADEENRAINEDGDRISEWSLNMKEFLNQLDEIIYKIELV
jgi:CdiI N-terminal domain